MDDVLGQTTSTTDAVASEAEASPAQRYLEALVVLPGAEHVVVVDVSGQRILAEWGEPEGSTLAVLDRARRAADPSRNGRRQLEDITSTTASAFHLSCFVIAGPGRPESFWVGLRVDRSRGNLTWSKGALTRLNGLGGLPSSVTPAGEEHPVVPVADDAEVAAPAAPAPTVVSPPAPPSPAPAAPPVAAPSKARIALTARAVPLTFTTPDAPESLPATPRDAVPTADTGDEPDTADTATAEPATTVEMATPPPVVPAARTSSENRPEPSTPAPPRQSSFAPVMVVLPPPAPIPDDGTFEEPAPMPAPMIVAPDLPVAGRAVETEDTVAPAADEAGAGDSAPIRPASIHPVPVRRTPEVRHPAVRLPAPVPSAPPRPPAPAPTHEPTITRRLFHGLRRRP